MMKKHINPSLADEIDFSAQIDAFMDMVNYTYSIIRCAATARGPPALTQPLRPRLSHCRTMTTFLSLFSTGIVERLEPAFKTLRKLNLAFTETVGDEEQYVKLINKELNATIPRIRMGMSPVYFSSFCMKLCEAVMAKVLENVWKMKRMSKVRTQAPTYTRPAMPCPRLVLLHHVRRVRGVLPVYIRRAPGSC
jgi:hypothetical protein